MKRKTLIAGGVVVLIGLAGVAGVVTAQGGRDGWSGHHRGPGAMMGHGMMGMMRRHHSGMMKGGMMGRGMGMRMMEKADADDDGRVTSAEAANFRAEQIATYDTDGDGSLSLEEFSALHAAQTRPMIVDRFQAFDDDGDGKVTEAEMAGPFNRMLRYMDSDGDGAIGPSDMRRWMGQGLGMGPMMGRGMGPMMQDDTSGEN